MQPRPKKFSTGIGKVTLGFVLAVILPAGIYVSYAKLQELELGLVQEVHVGRPIKLVYEAAGINGVLGVAVAFVVLGVLVAISGFMNLKSLKSEIGVSEFERHRFEHARERHKRETPLSGMPKHLESVEAHAAYSKRIRNMFALMFVVFAIVGIVGVFL